MAKGLKVKIQNYASLFWMVLGDIQTPDSKGQPFVRSISQIPATQKEIYAKGFHALLKEGIYFAPSGYEVSFLSTAHQNLHFEKTLAAIEKINLT